MNFPGMRGWLLVVVLLAGGCTAVSPGNRGAKAFRAGRYEEALLYWKPLAEKDARAQCQVAYLYERGLGVKQDGAEAIRWYEKAASQGDSYAENSLAQLYARDQPQKSQGYHKRAAGHGHLGSQLALAEHLKAKGDFDGSIPWFEKAAAQGSLPAMLALAQGHRERKDSKQALTWASRAADLKSPEALCLLGQFAEEAKDAKSAQSYYRRASELGSAAGQFRLSGFSKPPEARALLLKAGEQGYTPALMALARLSLGQKDTDTAQRWLRKAAEQGVAEAEFELGQLGVEAASRRRWFQKAYAHGYRPAGVELGKIYAQTGPVGAEQEAVLALAAEAGEAEAQYRLGDLLRRAGSRDQEAARWYLKAAQQGHALACYSLGRMIEEGRAYRQDDQMAQQYYAQAALAQVPQAFYAMGRMKQKLGKYSEALTWYHRAGEANVPEGYYALGLCYEEGEGVPKDTAQAEKYYLQADIPESYYALGRLYELRRDRTRALEFYEKAGDLAEAIQARQRLQL